MKTIVTVTGIRPDFIRMSEIFKKLDKEFNHILIHTGQHYDDLLSGVFFDELKIRKPDHNLAIGGPGKEHFHQTADLSVSLIELFRNKKIDPSIVLFLGDSNSVVSAVSLKKEGYKVGHIEAGMRSGDKRMLEEINRMVCDTCSDLLFVYHENYRKKLEKENIVEGVHVVGNTIVEVAKKLIKNNKNFQTTPTNNHIILDVHRPENFNYSHRLKNIIEFTKWISAVYRLPVIMLEFGRTKNKIEEFGIDLGDIEVVPLMSYKKYMNSVYNSKFIISDSGTAQEEPALLGTPVLVPRGYTERPESVEDNCSMMIDMEESWSEDWYDSLKWLQYESKKMDSSWLGNGMTSTKIIEILKNSL
jgi:UDP-N-acetylglucosamine 2-epimerase|tara:strand:- start:25512 stop:26588 length:1077 start_codon:yes stop_codon:yes gene_type:complete